MRALMRDAVRFIEAEPEPDTPCPTYSPHEPTPSPIEAVPVGKSFRVKEIPHADAFEQICIAEMLTKMGWLRITGN